MTDFKNENVWLMQGDCLDRMKEIETDSVDTIIVDLPYGTTACKWDAIIPFTRHTKIKIRGRYRVFYENDAILHFL